MDKVVQKRESLMSSKKLTGKVAVVTGGNSGIGLASAQLLHAEGAKVAIMGRDRKTIDSALKTIGEDSLGFAGDVSSIKDLEAFMSEVKSKFGKIDTLFVNAGIAKSSPISDASEAFYDEMFGINVKGAFFTVQKALPLLKDGGTIVMCTSIVSHYGMANSSVYAGTKAALRSFVQCLAAELLPRGIRVNCVSPGPIETPILARSGVDANTLSSIKEYLTQTIPMKRMGKPEEVAKAVLYLASDESSFTTGSEIMVDGGWTQIMPRP
jgi:NAD(P)-dependent dehydrogenase (short-subunit alcohol dehydrogenase family)